MRSMLVIGLGLFGTNLAIRLSELGNEVMAIDRDEEKVNQVVSKVTRAQIGDCMVPDVLASLGVSNFDVCFVCIGEHLQSALEITSHLKELGARHVVTKADNEMHSKFLLKLGADEVIIPEKDMAYRAAAKYSVKNALDYFEFSPDFVMYEIMVPGAWTGKTIRELSVRSKHNINILGLKKDGKVVPVTDADYAFSEDDRLIITGEKEAMLRFTGGRGRF